MHDGSLPALSVFALESVKEKGEESRKICPELDIEGGGDRFDEVDDDGLQQRAGGPELCDYVEDRRQVNADVLLDHGDQLTEVLEVELLQSRRTYSHGTKKSRDDLGEEADAL